MFSAARKPSPPPAGAASCSFSQLKRASQITGAWWRPSTAARTWKAAMLWRSQRWIFVNFTNPRKESQPAVIAHLTGRTIEEVRPSGDEREKDSDDRTPGAGHLEPRRIFRRRRQPRAFAGYQETHRSRPVHGGWTLTHHFWRQWPATAEGRRMAAVGTTANLPC